MARLVKNITIFFLYFWNNLVFKITFYKFQSCIILVAATIAIAAVNGQFIGYGPYGYATTATSFSLPFIGGFQYAPAVKAIAPVPVSLQ